MVFLIMLIVATAVLIGWLLFQVARLSSGGLRLPRFHVGSLQGAPGGVPSIRAGNGARGDPVAVDREAQEQAEAEDERRQGSLEDEADVEQAVYDRLYGQRGRRA